MGGQKFRDRSFAFRSVLFFFALLIADFALAADAAALRALFQEKYVSLYRPNRCGENIESFIRTAQQAGIDMQGAELIHIENTGGFNFGLVAAHNARGQGTFVNPEERPTSPRNPGSTNWGFHVVLLAEGQVFDVDFDSQPKVLALGSYVPWMFFGRRDSEGTRARILEIYKASVYKVKAVDPERAFTADRSEILEAPSAMKLQELMER